MQNAERRTMDERGCKLRTSNVERPTSNAKRDHPTFDIQSWTLDVGRSTFASLFVLRSAFYVLHSLQ